MKFSSLVPYALVFTILIGCSNSYEIPKYFYGNYFDTTGLNYWVCLIHEDFVVYENDFWSYKIKSISESEIELRVYKESGEKKRVKVSKSDTYYTLFDGNQEIICSKNSEGIQIKPRGELPVMDAGVAVIKGVVFDDTTKNTQVKIEAEKYFSYKESEVRISEVDEMGRFSISIPMLNSQSVFLICGKHRWRRIFITPGDSLTILINGQNGKPIHFMGTNSDVCYHTQYVLEQLHDLGEARTPRWELKPMDFRRYIDSLASVQRNFLEIYSSENLCPDLFVSWCERFIECSRLQSLGSYSFMSTIHGSGTGNTLTADHPYYNYIESINFNDTLRLLEANAGDVIGVTIEYYNKVLREEINSQTKIQNEMLTLIKEYHDQIPDEKYAFIESFSDSLKANITVSHKLVSELFAIAEPFRDEYGFRLMKARMDRRINFFLGQEYSLMRDLMLMKIYDDIKQARMLDVLDHVFNRIDTSIQYSVFREDLKNDYSALLTKIESLQNIDFVSNKSSESGEKLLLDIINSNQDTVIILDFWFAACGPCRTGFMKIKSIKKQLYDVPIKFVYLCYSSSEKDWANVIKEYEVKGDHYLLTGEQFAYFSNLLNISSAPRYVLIGKNGKIANDNFVQPQSYQQYMEALRKYLRE